MNNQIVRILDLLNEELSNLDIKSTTDLLSQIQQVKTIFLAGAGRSKMIAAMFAMRLMHCGLKSYVVGETTTPSIKQNDLLLIYSGSGETAQLVQFAKQAKEIGSTIGLITTKSQSTLGDIANFKIVIEPVERTKENILPLGSRFELSAAIYSESVIINLMKLLNMNDSEMRRRHANLE